MNIQLQHIVYSLRHDRFDRTAAARAVCGVHTQVCFVSLRRYMNYYIYLFITESPIITAI